jgi:hypothetical protein
MELNIVSSIPPELRGSKLEELNPQSLQLHVLKSWEQLTERIYSVHTAHELVSNPNHSSVLSSLGCSTLVINKISSIHKPHLPSISDILLAASQANLSGILVITNSDIIFSDAREICSFINSIKSNQLGLSRRVNVNSLEDFTACGNDNAGFDFFAFHSDKLDSLVSLCPDILQFGVPWWDLYFPLVCIAAGLSPVQPRNHSRFLHINHQDRWDSETWYRTGFIAYEQFMQILEKNDNSNMLQTLADARHAAARAKFASIHIFLRHIRCQGQNLLHNKSFKPLYLFALARILNQLLDVRSLEA